MASDKRVGRTAFGAAAMRAAEMFVPERMRLFHDPLIIDFLPTASRFAIRRRWIREPFLKLLERSAPGIRGALLCRTRAIDDAVNAAIARGLSTAIILGAGLDTRPCRLESLQNAAVIELDLPSVQSFKQQRLIARFGALPPQLRLVPTDFSAEPLDRTLQRAGLDPSVPAVFVWEGVTQYLNPGAVDAVLGTIAARPRGTELIFTYVLEEVVTGNFRRDRSEVFRKAARRMPAKCQFGIDPAGLSSFLSQRGLALQDDIGAPEHLARYVRPLGRELAVSEIERTARAVV